MRDAGRALAFTMAALLVCAACCTGKAAAAGYAATADCQEHQAFVDGSEAAVAARLPKRYTPVRDASSGAPLVFSRAIRCSRVTLDGRTGPAMMASYGVVIESPDGKGCASGTPAGSVKGDMPPVCNWYVLSWLADDRRVIDWLRGGTPGFPVTYVPHMTFDLGAFDLSRGGEPLHFEAPSPAPSPFTMDEVARERPGQLSVRVGYWVDTPEGTVKIAGSTDDLTSGDANGTVRPAPGSDMAALFGAGERSYVPGYSSFAAERWGHLTYRKQILSPPASGDSFAGSCSVQGTVTFSPPATYSAGPLTYGYDASGTCTGTLDGRSVSNVPVKLHHAGHSEASCAQAATTEPGQGTIAFSGGPTLPYTIDFTSAGSEVSATVYGTRSGSAPAHGTFLTQRTPLDVSAQCAGSGASEVPMDFSLTTDSPLVSERPAAERPAPAHTRRSARRTHRRHHRR